ncbi:hypothetical protein G7Y89_g7932 [Cudoniella acicularis]|uniref:methylated diphthine methylhydrolase n=1 Tax=Cudoniella acicularis TaxID=354080 RepID=A0A8H4W3C1_9HELO|nr:hypothetical protein G7Y89_g7932 [Cudoniella acicularis]
MEEPIQEPGPRLPGKWTPNIDGVTFCVLDTPPSCVEFVPYDAFTGDLQRDPKNHFFIVGTYDLQKEQDSDETSIQDVEGTKALKSQSRFGSLNLFKIYDNNQLTLLEKLSHPSAILDLHFLSGEPIFAVASSTGTISIYEFVSGKTRINNEEIVSYKMRLLSSCQLFPPEILVLSFTWYPDCKRPMLPVLAVTASSGGLYLVRFEDWTFFKYTVMNDSAPIYQHLDQAWCCAISSLPPGIDSIQGIFSGGDDSKLHVSTLDLRKYISEEAETSSIADVVVPRTVKGHDAGVTAILFFPFGPFDKNDSETTMTFLTGSYDDCARVWSYQPNKLRAPKEVAKLSLGGGGWRLKFLQEYKIENKPWTGIKYRVLASCMFAGAKILEVEGGLYDDQNPTTQPWTIKIVASMNVHQSMCYACDVQPSKGEKRKAEGQAHIGWNDKQLCVSTSFYDRLVYLWMYDPLLPESDEPVDHPVEEIDDVDVDAKTRLVKAFDVVDIKEDPSERPR